MKRIKNLTFKQYKIILDRIILEHTVKATLVVLKYA